MYAGFSLIVILFITTVILMLNGTSNIHTQMKSVSSESLPLVSLSNETSVALLAADKSFKDFLTDDKVVYHHILWCDATLRNVATFRFAMTIKGLILFYSAG